MVAVSKFAAAGRRSKKASTAAAAAGGAAGSGQSAAAAVTPPARNPRLTHLSTGNGNEEKISLTGQIRSEHDH